MKALGERSIASFIRVVLDAVWWLVVVALTLFIGLFLVSFGVGLEGKNLTVDLPVALKVEGPIHEKSTAMETDARFERLRGNLRFPVKNDGLFSGSLLVAVLLGGCLLWVVSQLRHIFRSLSLGLVFVPENARRIRWVGFTVIFGEFVRAAVVYLCSYYSSLHFTANGMRFVAWTDFSGTTIVGGLAILVIAEVFREGTRLHEEQSLTI